MKETILTGQNDYGFSSHVNINTWKNFINKVPMSGKISINNFDKFFKNNRISGIRIIPQEGKKNERENENWNFSGVSMQCKVAAQTNSKFFKENADKIDIVRNTLESENLYENFNRLLILELCNPNVSLNKRKAISRLMADLMSKKPNLIKKIFNDLDIINYLVLNVLQEKNSTFLEVFSFLRFFITLENFGK